MLASIIIAAISSILFLYWLRYACVLILNAKTSRDYAADVAFANELSFLQVQQQIVTADGHSLDALQALLERDFGRVNLLLEKAAAAATDGMGFDEALLRADFHGMKLVYRLSRSMSQSRARQALQEMSQIIGYLANSCGERMQASAASI